jgi:hypothetical protein
MEQTTETDLRAIHRATQVARLHDAVAFLSEANIARQANLTTFTDQVSQWATRQNEATARLQQELVDARVQIDQLAAQRAQVPLPNSRSATPASQPAPINAPTYLQGAPPRPPRSASIRGWFSTPSVRSPSPPDTLPPNFGANGGSPPRRPRREARSPSPPRQNPMTEFAEILVQTLATHLPGPRIENQAPRQAPVKIPKSDFYDGKQKTPFRSRWKTNIHYFHFYPETRDELWIAFVGALLTDEAKEWYQARDDLITSERGRLDNWVSYSEAIINEYTDPREGAMAHDKLKALK